MYQLPVSSAKHKGIILCLKVQASLLGRWTSPICETLRRDGGKSRILIFKLNQKQDLERREDLKASKTVSSEALEDLLPYVAIPWAMLLKSLTLHQIWILSWWTLSPSVACPHAWMKRWSWLLSFSLWASRPVCTAKQPGLAICSCQPKVLVLFGERLHIYAGKDWETL